MNIAKYIDHTLLKPETKKDEIKKICEEAREHGFFSVCVNGVNVAFAYEQLKGTDVKVAAVVGFPLGAMTSEAKAFETKDVIDNGAKEIDMVINIGALKEGKEEEVLNDIKAVVDAASGRAIVKVIIENCLLTNEEKILACKLAKKAGADFVKTSTGFSTGGATVEDVQLMRETVGPEMGVKASGGVRDLKTALAMIEAGATRIGASASVSIVKDENSSVEGY
ncbi:deoxyribose-phosphate aldolase [Alkaliphilus sp. B6464]|uniref:deoxyribose-phosphate aldolase n=1 Tax=Alkaliphilus sp. B6464 TaxID=2731219 RepID=UPI001BA87DB4|nr:deoxyribose-phosphate aldolase [Alkaliphilus sp. B6464]QUH20967.1 deoxyribose-phosphate aldolase [Alkaliphilus sp. B6464]